MSAPQTAPGDPTARERRIRKRTIKNLRRALREGDEQLSPLWVRIDPDFAFFRRERNTDEDWQELVERPAVDRLELGDRRIGALAELEG